MGMECGNKRMLLQIYQSYCMGVKNVGQGPLDSVYISEFFLIFKLSLFPRDNDHWCQIRNLMKADDVNLLSHLCRLGTHQWKNPVILNLPTIFWCFRCHQEPCWQTCVIMTCAGHRKGEQCISVLLLLLLTSRPTWSTASQQPKHMSIWNQRNTKSLLLRVTQCTLRVHSTKIKMDKHRTQ